MDTMVATCPQISQTAALRLSYNPTASKHSKVHSPATAKHLLTRKPHTGLQQDVRGRKNQG